MDETRILLIGGHSIDVMLPIAEVGSKIAEAKAAQKDVVFGRVHYLENRKAKCAIPLSSIVALVQIVEKN